MGVFDTVECLYPLPEGYEHLQEDSFQTKSLYSTLDTYTINRKGRLIHHRPQYEEVPEEEREYYGTEKWNEKSAGLGFIWRTFGAHRLVEMLYHDEEWHGDISIYTHRGTHEEKTFEWFEFTIRFTHGEVEWIRRSDVRG